MRQILSPIPLCRVIRSNPPHVRVQLVPRAQRRAAIALAEPPRPVLALLLLDLETGSMGKGAEVSGIHEGAA